ncbi:hypothetical protein FGIG_11215 [Fasciola gigantica]|uniref:Uncharacterized protein n=1 Tax=Fasciola gigantica TaxID=46835 RepID=A0A504Z203_FASGI|nr:hypothetical protein FGIG_11215 [Fasciola gigantica]
MYVVQQTQGVWMVYYLPYFFANQSNTVITANPFQTMACKLDDQVPSKRVPYEKTVLLIGFAQFQVLSVPGDPKTITMKPGGIYTGLREDAVKSELLDMLDASFGSISNGIAPSVLQKDSAGEQQDEEEELHHSHPTDVGYKARALLKETWSDSLDNLSDPRAQNLSQTFCKDIQAAYASAFYEKDLHMNCSNYKFFMNTYTDPITKVTSQYTTISMDFTFQEADFIHFSGAEMAASVNQGLMKIDREYQSKTIGSIQIMRLSESFTCAKDGDRCSKWATCVQLSSGIACVCSFLHSDVDKSMPGTVCHYNMSVMILYAVLGAGSFCALLMAILFVSRGPRAYHMTG